MSIKIELELEFDNAFQAKREFEILAEGLLGRDVMKEDIPTIGDSLRKDLEESGEWVEIGVARSILMKLYRAARRCSGRRDVPDFIELDKVLAEVKRSSLFVEDWKGE